MSEPDIDDAIAWISDAGLIGNMRLVQALLDQADISLQIQEKIANLLDVDHLVYGEGY